MSRIELKPDYYDDFHCIGGSCSFTCCQEWKIAVDKGTKKKWRSIKAPKYLKETGRLPEGISEHSYLNQFVVKADGSDVIGLLNNMKCPFLDEDNLCSLVKEHGEEILSHTCHTFPRETHIYDERVERALVSCCPEIIDRWNGCTKLSFTNLDYTNKDYLRSTKDKLKSVRDLMMYHLSSHETTNCTNLLKAFFILLDIYKKDGDFNIEDYLDDISVMNLVKSIEALENAPLDSLIERNELFIDMTENYAREDRYTGILKPLRDIASELEPDAAPCTDFNNALQPFENLLRNFLVSETFSNLLIPGMDLKDMVMQFQWMMMEYAIIIDALYLRWLSDSKHTLSYDSVREIIVLISRLTGYDADDIEEYLNDCFESPLWDFSYAYFLLCL